MASHIVFSWHMGKIYRMLVVFLVLSLPSTDISGLSKQVQYIVPDIVMTIFWRHECHTWIRRVHAFIYIYLAKGKWGKRATNLFWQKEKQGIQGVFFYYTPTRFFVSSYDRGDCLKVALFFIQPMQLAPRLLLTPSFRADTRHSKQ